MDDNRWTFTISIPKPSLRISLATLLVITVVGGMFLGLAGRRMVDPDTPTGRELEVGIEDVIKKMDWVEEAYVSVEEKEVGRKTILVSLRAKSDRSTDARERDGVWDVVKKVANVDKENVAVFDLNSTRVWSQSYNNVLEDLE